MERGLLPQQPSLLSFSLRLRLVAAVLLHATPRRDALRPISCWRTPGETPATQGDSSPGLLSEKNSCRSSLLSVERTWLPKRVIHRERAVSLKTSPLESAVPPPPPPPPQTDGGRVNSLQPWKASVFTASTVMNLGSRCVISSVANPLYGQDVEAPALSRDAPSRAQMQ